MTASELSPRDGAEGTASDPCALVERQLLLTRINHLDSLAVTIRNIGIAVFLAAFGACAGLKLGVGMTRANISYDAQFAIPFVVAVAFLMMEARTRSKYELCRERWNLLAGRPRRGREVEQAGRAFDWIDRQRNRWSNWLHRDLVAVYGVMGAVTLLGWLYRPGLG